MQISIGLATLGVAKMVLIPHKNHQFPHFCEDLGYIMPIHFGEASSIFKQNRLHIKQCLYKLKQKFVCGLVGMDYYYG